MRCYERAMVHDLFTHAVQVDRLLSPSCKRSFCSVLSVALRARWLPDGPGKVFALGYCRPACLFFSWGKDRDAMCVCVCVCMCVCEREREREWVSECKHESRSPTFCAHNSSSSSTQLAGSHPWHSTIVYASGSQSEALGPLGVHEDTAVVLSENT